MPRRSSLASLMLGTLVAPVARRARPGGLRILAYHEISDPASFERHLDILATEYTVVSGRQVAAAVRTGAPVPPRAVWITFDDGYTSVVDTGLPLLVARGLTATMFVSPGVVDEARRSWWEIVTTAIGSGWYPTDDATIGVTDIDLPVDVAAALRHLMTVDDDIRRTIVAAADRHLATLDTATTPVLAPVTAPLTVSREHLARWLDHGMELGNHTWEHPCLDHCSVEAQREQILRADEWLREFGAFDETRLFAYPNGDHTAVAEATLADLGYDIGLLFDHRIADPTTAPLRMSRLQIDDRASVHRLRATVSGANSAARRLLRHTV